MKEIDSKQCIRQSSKQYNNQSNTNNTSKIDSEIVSEIVSEIDKCQLIIYICGKPSFVETVTRYTSGLDLYKLILCKYGIMIDEFYITDTNNHHRIPADNTYYPFNDNEINQTKTRFVNVSFRLKGGGIAADIFNSILGAIFKVFSPIIKPLKAIANAFLLLIKAIIYIIALAIWFFKVMAWFFVQFLPSLPFDIILLIQQMTLLLVSTIMQTISTLVARVVNWFGRQTLYSISTGWDNARDSNTLTTNTSDTIDPKACTQHCYRTPDGSIPFSVVAVTVLCPPVGVFMEFGVTGWLKILVCFILTLMMYFPGLIYALILLYC